MACPKGTKDYNLRSGGLFLTHTHVLPEDGEGHLSIPNSPLFSLQSASVVEGFEGFGSTLLRKEVSFLQRTRSKPVFYMELHPKTLCLRRTSDETLSDSGYLVIVGGGGGTRELYV